MTRVKAEIAAFIYTNKIIIKDCIYIRKLQNKLFVTEQITL